MFLTLAALLFSGYPVAFVLGGVALTFGLIGYFLGTFRLIEFFNFVPRIWGQAAENLVLVSIPTFIFMGVVMERSGIANDLLYCVQVLLEARARLAGARRHHHGHDPCRHDRHHRRLGDHDDGAGAAHHDAAGLQPCAGLRHHCGGGNARDSDTAEHHADHHGRPARRVGRPPVLGRARPGPDARGALPALHLHRGDDLAEARSAAAARAAGGAQGPDDCRCCGGPSSRRCS